MSSIFESFAQYPFSSDPVFQSGLAHILEPLAGKPEHETSEVIGRAKAFYFSKAAGVDIKWEDYVRYRDQQQQQQPRHTADGSATETQAQTQLDSRQDPSTSTSVSPPVSSAGVGGAPTPLSFAKLADLINSGQTHLIPNNDIIPNELNPAEPSLSRAQVRRNHGRQPNRNNSRNNSSSRQQKLQCNDPKPVN